MPKKLEKMVKAIKKRGGARNPHAVARAQYSKTKRRKKGKR